MDEIKRLYLEGNSAQEIKDKLNLKLTPRSIQRQLAHLGLTRTVADSYRLAMSKDRIKWAKKQTKIKRLKLKLGLRYLILQRDNFKCKKCGNTAEQALLEVDHIDGNPRNNKESNLEVLCELCNLGKYQSTGYRLGE